VKSIRRIVREQFPFLLTAPALLWQAYFLYLPAAALFFYSFWSGERGRFFPFSFDHYRQLIDPLYFQIFFNSLRLATFTSLTCLIIGYPVAHFLALRAGRFRMPLLIFLILPSWTNFVVQVYAWFFLLKKGGFVSSVLSWLVGQEIYLLNSQMATFIGMVYCYLPFMIFPLFSVLDRIDKNLLEASADLGANRFETLRRVVGPLSFPGIAAGMLLVFVPAFGEFVIPDLLGGSKHVFLGSGVVDKFLVFRDWQSGSAFVSLGVLMPIFTVIATIWISRMLRKKIMTINVGKGDKNVASWQGNEHG